MATVGGNFKKIRERKKLTQEQLYRKLGYQRPANVSILETRKGIPTPKKIRFLAAVLNCEPWELLEGVKFPYDELRHPTDVAHAAREVVEIARQELRQSRRTKR